MIKLDETQADDVLYPAGVTRKSTPVDELYDTLFPPGIGPAQEDRTNEKLPPLMDD